MVSSLAKSEVTGEIQLKRVINALQFMRLQFAKDYDTKF